MLNQGSCSFLFISLIDDSTISSQAVFIASCFRAKSVVVAFFTEDDETDELAKDGAKIGVGVGVDAEIDSEGAVVDGTAAASPSSSKHLSTASR